MQGIETIGIKKKIIMKGFQADFMESKARFQAFVAGWGTGKTLFACCLKPTLYCLDHPGAEWLIVRKERTRLEESTILDFEKMTGIKVDSHGIAKIRNPKWPESAKDSIIMFRHGEQINKVEVLQNMNLNGFSIEQAEEFETDRQFQMLRGRIRADEETYGCISANTNGHNWIWRLFKAKKMEPVSDEIVSESMKETGLTEKQTREAFNPAQYALFEATTFDNKDNLPVSFIQDIARIKVESPHHYNRFVLNSWEDIDTEDKVIPYSHIMAAVRRDKVISLRYKTLVCCDPCEMGSDEGIIYGLSNATIIRHKFFKQKTGDQIAAYCQIMRKEIKGQTTVLDNIGIGSSTKDFLSKMDEPTILADSRKAGSRKEGKFTGFFNLRAEMWWAAKKEFKEGTVVIPDDPELIEELAAVAFELTACGYKVESKEILRKADRLGRSPNKADCFVYGLWGLGKIDYDDEAIYPDDDDFYGGDDEDAIAQSYSLETNL